MIFSRRKFFCTFHKEISKDFHLKSGTAPCRLTATASELTIGVCQARACAGRRHGHLSIDNRKEPTLMVFVRVQLMKGRLSAARKEELGAALIQAVSEVENLVNNQTHKETSWVQFFEFDPENWYAPANVAGADPDSRVQLDVIAPQGLLSTPEEARTMLDKANEAVRSVFGPGELPAHGPWVHVYIIPPGQWGFDGRVPDWEGFRARLRADTEEEADEALARIYGPGRHSAVLFDSPAAPAS
ncbi:hypothetical protein [Streptomyces sp. AK02-01A]|uniref:tautomerase family protein n=1 Tax=Streptomyces sp. AK02-01A TaxID=3028648 RepID=UPI0029A13A1E|nr:hypothetical protein [Streptomyces sp. AK02-01A]MDX3852331.1 hypothetical protein [Streptomyces sp. AK02-01A]